MNTTTDTRTQALLALRKLLDALTAENGGCVCWSIVSTGKHATDCPVLEAEKALEELEGQLAPIQGTWPANDIRRVFVAGAKWWEFTKSGATMWSSDVRKAEQEADRRYALPSID